MNAQPRLASIDLLRGLVIVLMALDHTRDFFGPALFEPENLAATTPAWYWTRWITHLCATVFVSLAGASAWLRGAKSGVAAAVACSARLTAFAASHPGLARYLATRGALLLAVVDRRRHADAGLRAAAFNERVRRPRPLVGTRARLAIRPDVLRARAQIPAVAAIPAGDGHHRPGAAGLFKRVNEGIRSESLRKHGPPVGWLLLFGRTPMFFYTVHIAPIHLLGNLYFEWRFDGTPDFNGPVARMPAGYEPSLAIVYLAWLCILPLMYTPSPACGSASGAEHPKSSLQLLAAAHRTAVSPRPPAWK